MTALANTSPTLLDLTKRLDPDGSIATIAELLSALDASFKAIGC